MRAPVLTLLVALAVAAPAGAAELRVDSFAPGNGNCAVAGSCTLRQAIVDAAGLPGKDTIRLPPGTYDQTGQDLIVSIGEQLEITGEDPRTTHIREVSGGDGRVFLVEQDAGLDLSGVTLSGSRGASAVLLFGGGAAFRATNVVLTGNTAANGAAIDATGGTATLTDSAVVGNAATAKGGGIYLGGAASALVTRNVTVAGNTAPDGAGIAVDQGAATLTATTVAQNGGAPDVRGPATLHASIAGSCAAPLASLGGSVSGDPMCGADRTAPLALGGLGDHGGTTPTILPAASSPAIDADAACAAGGADQRGAPRPQGAGCDAGAVELPATTPTPPSVAGTPPPVRISALRVRPTRWRPASRAARVTFRATGAATVRFTVQRAKRGRPSRFVTVRGAFARRAATGANRVRFRLVGGRRLRPGRYRLVARVGGRSPVVRAGFTVVGSRVRGTPVR